MSSVERYVFQIVTDQDQSGFLGLEYKGEVVLFDIETPAWNILSHYYNGGDVRPIPEFLAAIVFFDMLDDEAEYAEDE